MQLYWARRSASLCVDCGRFAEARRVRCALHLKRINGYMKQYAQARRGCAQ